MRTLPNSREVKKMEQDDDVLQTYSSEHETSFFKKAEEKLKKLVKREKVKFKPRKKKGF